jgi:hypothetical protein
MAEQFANNASALLSGSMDGSTDPVTFNVDDGSPFPSSGNFRVIIDAEILKVTSRTGNSLTAARNQEGTTKTTHSSAAPVTHILTKASLLALLSDMHLTGTFASRPSAGILGRWYQATDTPFRYYDNGTTWDKFYGTYPIVTPDDSGYTWDNQSSITRTTTKDMVALFPTNTFSARYVAAPSTPYIITAAFLINWDSLHTVDAHIGWRQSSDGKIVTLSVRHAGGVQSYNVWKWNTTTSFNASYRNDNRVVYPMGSMLFLRIIDDGTNRKCATSVDGVNFTEYHSVGRTDFLTGNQVLFGVGSDSSSDTSSISLMHWKVE